MNLCPGSNPHHATNFSNLSLAWPQFETIMTVIPTTLKRQTFSKMTWLIGLAFIVIEWAAAAVGDESEKTENGRDDCQIGADQLEQESIYPFRSTLPSNHHWLRGRLSLIRHRKKERKTWKIKPTFFIIAVAQKLEGEDLGENERVKSSNTDINLTIVSFLTDLISVDGSIRVTSDEFSISLLSPESDIYQTKAQKYSQLVSGGTMTDRLFCGTVFHFVFFFFSFRFQTRISTVRSTRPL